MKKILNSSLLVFLTVIFLLIAFSLKSMASENDQYKMISGGNNIVALKSDGTVWAWGYNTSGQLGDGTGINRSTPVQVLGPGGVGNLTGVVSIAASTFHTVALKSDGTVWAWGNNTSGQLGDNTTSGSAVPVQVLGPGGVGYLTGVVSIAAGTYYTVALKSDGTVWTWGKNDYGQLGDNTTALKKTPIQVLGPGGAGYLTGIVSIAATNEHTVALKSDGTVWTWGNNANGRLGDNTITQRNTPVQVLGSGGAGNLTGVTAIAAGAFHTVALKSDGTVWAWGLNSFGRLGDNTTTQRNTPVQVLGSGGVGNLTGITAISAGYEFTAALKSDGTVWTWGRNNVYGQLGDNTFTNRYTPIQVLGPGGVGYLTGFASISVGNYHVVALKSNGTIWAWGDNTFGQLGDNTNTQKNVPIQTLGPGGVGFISLSGVALAANSTSPTNGATSVAIASTITITFNQNILSSTAYSNITLKYGSNTAAATTSILNNVLTITPSSNLIDGTVYTVTIPTSGVKDMLSNDLSTPYSFSFTTIVITPPVPSIITLPNGLLDEYNDNNAHDIRVIFKGAADETKIQEYRVIVSKNASLAADSAAALAPAATSTQTGKYMSEPLKGKGRLHLFNLLSNLKDDTGAAVNQAGGIYTVYVLSLAKAGYSNTITALGTIALDPNVPLTGLPAPTVIDIANNGNASDLKVTFKRPISELDVQEYRIFVRNTSAPAFDLAAANTNTNFKKVLATDGTRYGFTVILDNTMSDTRGTGNPIVNNQTYEIYVLAVMSKTGMANILSSPSKQIKLSATVPSALPIRGFSAAKVGSGHTGNNISATFNEPLSVTNVQEYRIFICTGVGSLDLNTANGIGDSTKYIKVDSTTKGSAHTVTLTGLPVYDGTVLAAGNYKVYVLTVGKTSQYANKLIGPSKVVKLD